MTTQRVTRDMSPMLRKERSPENAPSLWVPEGLLGRGDVGGRMEGTSCRGEMGSSRLAGEEAPLEVLGGVPGSLCMSVTMAIGPCSSCVQWAEPSIFCRSLLFSARSFLLLLSRCLM